MKSGFVLLSRDADLIGLALQAAAAVNIELRLLDEYPVISSQEYLVADPKALIDQPNLQPDILISRELSDSLWRFATKYAPAHLIQLPEAAAWFQTWLTSQQLVKSPVICFRSVSAAAGSSVLATAVSFIAAKQQDVVLVDLDHQRTSLNLLTGIDPKSGVTWEQLTNLSGLPSVSALFNGLPKLGMLRLLSFTKPSPPPPTSLIESVISLLQEQAKLVVVDAGSQINFSRSQMKQLVVAPCNLLGIGKVKQLLDSTNLVLRVEPKSGVTVSDASDYLNTRSILSYKSDPKLQLDISDGVIPGERKRSELNRISSLILEQING